MIALIGVVFTVKLVKAQIFVFGIMGCCIGSSATSNFLFPVLSTVSSTGMNMGSSTNTSGKVSITAEPLPFDEPGCIPRLNHSMIVCTSCDSLGLREAKEKLKLNCLNPIRENICIAFSFGAIPPRPAMLVGFKESFTPNGLVAICAPAAMLAAYSSALTPGILPAIPAMSCNLPRDAVKPAPAPAPSAPNAVNLAALSAMSAIVPILKVLPQSAL